MARTPSNGRSPTVSMADFNERAKRSAVGAPALEKAPERRRNPPRRNREAPPSSAETPAETPETDEAEEGTGEAKEHEEG